jgi:urease accessory protein
VKTVSRIGVGGPVGSGKTALIEAVVPKLVRSGLRVLVVTNDVVTTEDAKHVRRALTGVLVGEPIRRSRSGRRYGKFCAVVRAETVGRDTPRPYSWR